MAPMFSMDKVHTRAALLILLSAAAPLHGQYGKPSGIPQPLTVKKFDNKVTSVAIERLSSFGELPSARVLNANELGSLRDLYETALETQTVRAQFIRALQAIMTSSQTAEASQTRSRHISAWASKRVNC